MKKLIAILGTFLVVGAAAPAPAVADDPVVKARRGIALHALPIGQRVAGVVEESPQRLDAGNALLRWGRRRIRGDRVQRGTDGCRGRS